MVFVIHWQESAMVLHVFPIPIPPPTSLSARSLWVFPVYQARALVSCIQPGLVICFTLDNIHVSMLFSWNIPPSPSSRVQKSVLYICVSFSVLHIAFSLQDTLFIKPVIAEWKLWLLRFWDQLLGFSSQFSAFGEISLRTMTEIWLLLIPLRTAFLVEILLARWLPLVSESSLECLWIFFIYFWLHWVFVAAGEISLLVVMGATFHCGPQASHCSGFSCCWAWALGTWASVDGVHGLCCPSACGIFPVQGSNWCPPHWQVDS